MFATATKKSLIWIATLVCLSMFVACGGSTDVSSNGLCAGGCPSGQFCWNGLCVVGCNTNAECAGDQYCDTDVKQCANKTVSVCPDTPCGANQTCVNGYCSASAAAEPKKKDDSGACKPAADGNDGCEENELCIERDDEQTQCRSFPRCPQDGNCPAGLTGAVCNDKLIPNKARICLVGLCKTDANCPSSWKCVVPNGSAIGFCSDGSLGRPCMQADQCKDGFQCMQAASGTLGACFNASGPGFPDMPDFPSP